jgi:nucleotide-binding universal stress UspA family protein
VKILCAIDSRSQSQQAAEYAIDLAASLDAGLTFCMCNPFMPGRGVPMLLWSEAFVADVLERSVRRARWRRVRSTDSVTLRSAHIADAIAAHADACEIDLIVVGTSRRSALSRAMSGSVSRELLSKANCPVLVVHRLRDASRGRRGGRRIAEPRPVPDPWRAAAPVR